MNTITKAICKHFSRSELSCSDVERLNYFLNDHTSDKDNLSDVIFTALRVMSKHFNDNSLGFTDLDLIIEELNNLSQKPTLYKLFLLDDDFSVVIKDEAGSFIEAVWRYESLIQTLSELSESDQEDQIHREYSLQFYSDDRELVPEEDIPLNDNYFGLTASQMIEAIESEYDINI